MAVVRGVSMGLCPFQVMSPPSRKVRHPIHHGRELVLDGLLIMDAGDQIAPYFVNHQVVHRPEKRGARLLVDQHLSVPSKLQRLSSVFDQAVDLSSQLTL